MSKKFSITEKKTFCKGYNSTIYRTVLCVTPYSRVQNYGVPRAVIYGVMHCKLELSLL